MDTIDPQERIQDPDARLWGMLAHLLTLLGYVIGLGHFLPPLIIYLSKKDENEFIADQARESLNFQITVLLLALVCLPFICIGIGIVMLILLGIFQLVMVIVAGIQAHDGKRFRYPLTLRLVS
ncbi:MAG: DUF4870 domain-containing protein [Planctomycetes bacterium]|nr:DUF4870 domain-containing protein [Planctomycetota bacterium]